MKASRLRYLITSHAKRSGFNRYDAHMYVEYASQLFQLAGVDHVRDLPEDLPQLSVTLNLDEVSSQQIMQIAIMLLDLKHKRKLRLPQPLRITCDCGKAAGYSRHYHRYICQRCNKLAYAHKGDHWPMGLMANAAIRYKRKQCHELFEHLWVARLGNFKLAYQRLMEITGLPRTELHFGKINSIVDAHRVMATLETYAPEAA